MTVSAAMIRAKFTPEDLHMYRVTFEQFDEDGSGKIDVGELQRALRGCGIECTGDEVISMMSTVDESGDLEIDFDEFLQLIYNFRTEQEYASTSDSSDGDADDGGGGPLQGGGGGGGGAAASAVGGGGGGKSSLSGFGSYGLGGDEDALYGLGGALSSAYGGARKPPPANRRTSLLNRDSTAGEEEAEDAGGEDSGAGTDPATLHRRRTAAVAQCPEHSLRHLVANVRRVREDLIIEISDMAGGDVDEERRITMNGLQRLQQAKCPFVASGSFVAAVKKKREQHFATLLGSSAVLNGSAPSTSDEPAGVEGSSGGGGGGGQGPSPSFISPPTFAQIIAFIDEVLDAANERMMALVNMTMAYNSDNLYASSGEVEEEAAVAKRQAELLQLVGAAAGANALSSPAGSGARAAKRLGNTNNNSATTVGGGGLALEDTTSSSSAASSEGEGGDDEEEGPNRSKSPSRKRKKKKKTARKGEYGKEGSPLRPLSDSTTSAGQKQSSHSHSHQKSSRKVDAALDDLSHFSFEVARTADQQVGSDAFRAAAKRFPYFMFPMGSVCTVIDNLEKVHDTYEKALEGKEFLVKPRCKDGAKCRLLGVLEHQLALSHPCYSATIPCPHRHRPLHMICYHHDEDDNPSAQATLREMQKQLYMLDLSGLEIGDTGAKCVAHVLSRDLALRGKDKHRIRHLKLCGNQISPDGAAALFEHCGHLLSLDMSNNGLGYKGSMLSGSAIGPSLQKLLTTSNSLLSLNLSRNRLSDRDAKYLTESLKENTVLTTLDVQKNEFGSLFGGYMAAALQENRELRSLSLGWNRLEGVGTTTLLQEVCKTSTIEYLDLSWTGVSDDGAQLLADFISGSQLLRFLGLAHNNITGDGLMNRKGPDSQRSLTKAIQGSKALLHLDLSFNNLGTKATRDLLRELRENLVMETLDIRCVKASDDIVEEVKNFVKVRSSPPSAKPVVVQFGSSVVGMGGPTSPIRGEKMGKENAQGKPQSAAAVTPVSGGGGATVAGVGAPSSAAHRNSKAASDKRKASTSSKR